MRAHINYCAARKYIINFKLKVIDYLQLYSSIKRTEVQRRQFFSTKNAENNYNLKLLNNHIILIA